MTRGSSPSGQPFLLTWREFSGSLGDLGLFIPLVVSIVTVAEFDLGMVLVLAGLMNVATGLIFRQPIPVQPMKAIIAVGIAEGLVHNEIVAAGLIMGLVLICLPLFGLLDPISTRVPKSIVRGIQLGVGLKLIWKGLDDVYALPWWGWDSMTLAGMVLIALAVLGRYRQPGALYVFALGFVLLGLIDPGAWEGVELGWPQWQLSWPDRSDWLGGLLNGALPQLPLTLLNSVIAVCALSADYFPRDPIAPRRMALSVGLMNLLCLPLGGVPMCHGAGGLAAQYRFGARSGSSVVILGSLKVACGRLFGASLVGLLHSYPMPVLAPMLMLAGLQLAKAASDMKTRSDRFCVIVMALVILQFGVLPGFLTGCGLWAVSSVVVARRHQ